MLRVTLCYLDSFIELQPGATVVGRGIGCQLRFNDPAISRNHMKLEVDDRTVTLADLDSRNGTQINGQTIRKAQVLKHGDEISIGDCVLTVSIHRGNAPSKTATTQKLPAFGNERPTARPPSSVKQINCPNCAKLIPPEAALCPGCGYVRPAGNPFSDTGVFHVDEIKKAVKIAHDDRRRSARIASGFLVMYSSDLLELEGYTSDISTGGLFVATPVLDEVGTACRLVLLPDAAPALELKGVVRRAVTNAKQPNDVQSGMGIEFVDMQPETALRLCIIMGEGVPTNQ